MLLTELIDTLSRVKLCTSDLDRVASALWEKANQAIRAHEALSELGLLPLTKIATSIMTWSFTILGVEMDIPWQDQTRARHLYGGCFPDHIDRDVVVNDCTPSLVYRRYKFRTNDAVVSVMFYRPTFDGDKVDGCKVKLVSTPFRDTFREIETRSYLSISCPVSKGKS